MTPFPVESEIVHINIPGPPGGAAAVLPPLDRLPRVGAAPPFARECAGAFHAWQQPLPGLPPRQLGAPDLLPLSFVV